MISIVGTGGIGTGIAFALHGDASLGREESRAATLLDSRDFCKLHIVFHYLRTLLPETIDVVPVGAIGDDEAGRILRALFAETGLTMDAVRTIAGTRTLSAVSFSYPNGDGGNITAVGSASDLVGADDIREALANLRSPAAIVVALPEVPPAARIALLRSAPAGALRVASFVSAELEAGLASLADVDLIALNLDEARALTGSGSTDPADVAAEVSRLIGPGVQAIVTAGASGSWSWDGRSLEHARAAAAAVVSTAGAGDAHLAGVIAGLALDAGLHEANRLGAVVSALKVGAADAIRFDLDSELVRAAGADLDPGLLARLR
jgi:sugar/nucleoside kinase (ribokinase family)